MTTRYVAWLHAVNLGSHNKVPTAWLREAAQEAGFTDVSTYLQSGNLVVSADTGDAAEVSNRVAALIKTGRGLDVAVTTRTSAELRHVVSRNPMPEHVVESSKLLVSFLTGVPAKAKVAALDPDEFAPERYVVDGSHLYLWHPNGVGRSKLSTVPWEKRLGVRGTARNWRTVLAVLDLLDAASG
ncbi:MAG TPA: DUF1697 domain-containing protein [Mycobacteriales bacterium]|nr:DUF1697 domain-containing protein [Mycobacteriales bacterium]